MQQYTFSRAFHDGSDNERVFKEAAEAGVEDALSKGTSYLLFSYGAWAAAARASWSPHAPPSPTPLLSHSRNTHSLPRANSRRAQA